MVAIPSMGTHQNVPFAEYLRWPLLSQSVLKEGGPEGSMAALKAAMDGERKMVPTDDMLLGTALHAAFLEPEILGTKVVEWTGDRRYGTKWDLFSEQHAGQTILATDRYAKMVGMVAAMRAHPWVKRMTPAADRVEIGVVGELHGVAMKARADIDLPVHDMVVDVKKVRNGHDHAFLSAIAEYGYHWQAYVYTKLFGRSRFVLVTVEDAPPYDVCPYELSPAFIRQGGREVIPVLDQFKFAKKHNRWPGRSDDVIVLDPPEWMFSDDDVADITVNGDAAFVREE